MRQRTLERPMDDQQPMISTEDGRGVTSTAPLETSGRTPTKPLGWKLSLVIVGLTWLAVGFLTLTLYADPIAGLVARGLEPLVAGARDAVVVPGDPGNDAGSPLCRDVGENDARRLTRGITLMRRTHEGNQLYQELVDNDVCVTIRELTGYAGLALARQALGGWGHSTIEIDREHLETVGPDVLASTLVHEATHIDRSVRGTSCIVDDKCTVLDNGVLLDEEVAAHAAEARWWLAIYGRRGKSKPDPIAAWENHLAAAYLAGPATFETFVASFRSEPLDGTHR
jgi:hypothetical protein